MSALKKKSGWKERRGYMSETSKKAEQLKVWLYSAAGEETMARLKIEAQKLRDKIDQDCQVNPELLRTPTSP